LYALFVDKKATGRIQQEGAEAIAAVLKSNSGLTLLDLAGLVNVSD